jgi:integrase
MANIEPYTKGNGETVYRVRWRLGGTRDGERCAEPFEGKDALKHAERFCLDVELADHQWPANYVPRHGYVTPQELAALTALTEQADRPSKPFLPFAADYIDHLTGIEAKTRADYHRFVQNHMATFSPLADADLVDTDTLDARAVAEWVNWLEAGVRDPEDENGLRWLRAPKSPKTIANLHGLLYSIMQSATVGEKPLRKYNPCVGTRLPSLDDSTGEEMVFLTPAEFEILHNAADPTVRDVFLAFVGTGLRFSELTAQKVGDYTPGDVLPETRVQRAWKRGADNTFAEGAPKTKAGRRRVTLDELTAAAFAARCTDREAGEYTFTTRTGAVIRHNNFFGRYWQPAVYRAVRCEKHRQVDRDEGMLVDGELVRLTNLKTLRQRHLRPCGCPGTLKKVPRIHDLRHTHVAWQIAGNVPLSAIARRVGHESVNTTDKVYGHLLPELDTRQALAVAAALAGLQLGPRRV